MQSDDDTISLVWPAILVGGLILVGTMMYWGAVAPIERPEFWVPLPVRWLADGAQKLTTWGYLIPAVVIGVACALSAHNAFDAITSSLSGITGLAVLVVLAVLWTDAAALSGQIEGSSFKLGGMILALSIGLLAYTLAIMKPLILGVGAIAVSIHLGLSRVNENEEWMFDRTKYAVPRGVAFDLAMGAVVILFAAWTFFGGMFLRATAPQTPQQIVDTLNPPVNGKVIIESKDGRERTQRSVRLLGQEMDQVVKAPCDHARRSWLKTRLNSYFSRIRMIEDWKPGRPLSIYSEDALEVVKRSLRAGYVTWEELAPHVRIHLEEASYAARSNEARERLDCS